MALLKILLAISACTTASTASIGAPATYRARFTPEEVVELTLDFYRLVHQRALPQFGIIRSADYTMEQLVRVASCCAKSMNFAATSTSRRFPMPTRC